MTTDTLSKKLAGEAAAELVQDGMTVGLGTGSTVFFSLQRLGERIRQGLSIRAIATSIETEHLAHDLGIPLTSFAEVESIDMALDGADEVDRHMNLIKGGGGALVREKLVALAATRFVTIIHAEKRVDKLGQFPLPIEVIPFAHQQTLKRIRDLGLPAQARLKDGELFVTDNGNHIIDCRCGEIDNPVRLHETLKMLPGVVETGLFIGTLTDLVVSDGHAVQHEQAEATNSHRMG